jgi:glutamate synthase domain-containing protein 3
MAEATLLSFDLAEERVRELNRALHSAPDGTGVEILHPAGRHSIAAGLMTELDVSIRGHVGYYCAGMNERATVRVHGNCGTGAAENMMSGSVLIEGSASQSAGASAHGGLLVIHGDAAARCAISLKGADVLVAGSVGHLSAFMAQSGSLVVCGDAGEALGDSLYEARLYVRGSVASLGADCVEQELDVTDHAHLATLLTRGEIDADPGDFRRYGSARNLYHFAVDNAGSY